jgi:hypothetical protein
VGNAGGIGCFWISLVVVCAKIIGFAAAPLRTKGIRFFIKTPNKMTLLLAALAKKGADLFFIRKLKAYLQLGLLKDFHIHKIWFK